MDVRDRDYSISAIRFVAMCMIVACHVMQGAGNALAWHLNVGAQIFFVVSGWLHFGVRIDNPILFVARRSIRVLIPCYLFLLVVVPWYVWGADVSLGLRDVRGLALLRTLPSGLGHLWFVRNVVILYFITPYLNWLTGWMSCGSARRFCCLAGLFFAGVFCIGLEYHSVIHPASVMCYVAGYWMRAVDERYGKDLYWRFCWIAVAMTVVVLLFRIGVEWGCWPRLIRPYVAMLPFLKVAEGVGLFLGAKAMFAGCRRSLVLRLSDRYSYEVYLCHHVFLLGPAALLCRTFGGALAAVGMALAMVVSIEYVSGVIKRRAIR